MAGTLNFQESSLSVTFKPTDDCETLETRSPAKQPNRLVFAMRLEIRTFSASRREREEHEP